MKRVHAGLPFGTQLLEDGRVTFRLWAPAAQRVELLLSDTALPMARGDAGWHQLTTDRAHIGSRYRFRIDGDLAVPDPVSRYQPEDVHGPSEVIDPNAFDWRDATWTGRPWEHAVFYELHVGSFTSEGSFAGVKSRLDHLVALGVTAIELMPVSDFPGAHNWGYDGVLPFAPDSRYGRPEDLKDLVQSAHAKGLMVFLDVVYNHFGPEGNYLHTYAPAFFTERHHTPWGAAIDFTERAVRDFFIHNALYWLDEYHFDGLRLDAVHAIFDDSAEHILIELARTVRARFSGRRHVHLVLENDDNAARYLARDARLAPRWYDAQWNDDIHHALHVAVTGEKSGYYADYVDAPARHLARCLTEGFAYQGEPSPYRDGERRGESTAGLPPTAFVALLQNHDQIGNRAFGERISELASPAAVHAATAILLLAPSPPLLFMGQEWGADHPFPFFCDFGPDLAAAVTEGRRKEFARFAEFSDPTARARIPDPNEPATFARAILDWDALAGDEHQRWLKIHRHLLSLRRREVIPRLSGRGPRPADARVLHDRGIACVWRLGDDARLTLLANLSATAVPDPPRAAGGLLYVTDERLENAIKRGTLPPWSAAWFLAPTERETI